MSDFISVIRSEVEDVSGIVKQQINLGNQAADQIKSAFGPISGGSWTGAGADAFHNELMTKFLPELAALLASITGFGGNLLGGLDIFDQADSSAAGEVGGVIDSIGSLF